MRVAHVITRLIVGGAQENTIASVLGLQRIPGVDAYLISGAETGPEGSLARAFVSQSGSLTHVPELIRAIHPWKDFQAFRSLTKMFRRQRPDIVHTHSGKAGFLGRMAAHKAGVRIIIHTIHGPSFGNFQGSLANGLFKMAERLAGRITTHFVAVADAMTDQYLAAGIGSPSHYTKILSGFDLKPFLTAINNSSVRAKFGIEPGDFVIGKIARLFKLKGHEDLFRIAPGLVRKHPHVKFLLVGDGPWRDRFENKAATLGLSNNFIFAGLVKPEQVPELVGIMDILVHLSAREGLPRALPQALLAKKAVVAYDCDGADEVCVNEKTGFLVRLGDLGSLDNKIEYLLLNRDVREQFGLNGQALVKDQFPVEKMVQDLFRLYTKLLENSSNAP